MNKYILSLDQGTTSSRAILFDSNANIVALSQRELNQVYRNENWIENEPHTIFNDQYSVISELIKNNEIDIDDIDAIGISNQRETTILWDKKTGEPVYNAISWQCRRTSDICEGLKKKGHDKYIQHATGLLVDAYFSATKIKWILDNVEGARERAENGELLFGTVDTWLAWNLSKGEVHVTDYTNASRTMLFNIHTLDWDQKILDLLNIPKCILPEVFPSSHIFGNAYIEGKKIPIAAIAGDQQAALFGEGCFEKGQAKNTYGTGCFLLMNTGKELCKSKTHLLTTMAATTSKDDIQYVLEGSVFACGSIINWMRDEMHLFNEVTDAEAIAESVKDTNGVYVVPAFTGLGAPYWDMYARGCIIGINRNTKKSHIVRAGQECIAYQCMDLIECMEKDTGIKLTELNVDGGVTQDKFLLKFQSSILNITIQKQEMMEVTALGVAYLAGLAIGIWKNKDELKKNRPTLTKISPSMSAEERENAIKGWKKAVSRCRDWVEH